MKNKWRPITVLILILGIFIMMGMFAFGISIPEAFVTSYFTFCTVYITSYVAGRSYEKGKGVE